MISPPTRSATSIPNAPFPDAVGPTIAKMVQEEIHASDFTRIPWFREIIKTLPEEIRVCGEHGEAVHIEESDFSSNNWGSAPFGKAHWVGCSKEAIHKVVAAVNKTL